MSERPWFGPKRRGIGWTPVTWEGWLVTLCSMVIVVGVNLLIVALVASHHR